MTIDLTDQSPRVSYSVSEGATTTSFSVPFEFFDSADLKVVLDGTTKSISTHYTVSGGSGSTGAVAMSVTGASGGSTVIIYREIAFKRTTDFPTSGAFPIATLNTELDRNTALFDDQQDKINRSIRLLDTDDAATMTVPAKASRLGKILGFHSTTGAVEAVGNSATVTTIFNAIGDNALTLTGAITGGSLVADNITIDGNTISTTNTNGNLIVTPNGDGLVHFDGPLEVEGNDLSTTNTVTISPSAGGGDDIYAVGTNPFFSFYDTDTGSLPRSGSGTVAFHGKNASGSYINFGKVSGYQTDNTDSSVDGGLELRGMANNSEVVAVRIVGTDVTFLGKLIMPDVTSGKILVGDGTSYEEVAVSGDVTMASSGAVTIASGSVENSMLAGSIADSKLNAITTADKVSGASIQVDGATDGTGITVADADKFLIDDGGTTKYITASQLNSYVSVDATTAAVATAVTATANNSADETVYLTFVDGATGSQGIETDTGLHYNPSTGTVTASNFTGGLTGNASTSTTAVTLATARNIGGVSFNGSANINLPGVNTAGNQNTSGTAAVATVATTVTITDNENTDENNSIIFTSGGDLDGGNLGLESDGTLYYNPSQGRLVATQLEGQLQTAAQGNVTSLGTLTALNIDNININGNTITTTDTNGSLTISPNGTGDVVASTDKLIILATEGESATLMLVSDESDDNADDWQFVANASNNTLAIQNDISGSAVSQITLTPHATVASSTTAIAGRLLTSGLTGTIASSSALFQASGTNAPAALLNRTNDGSIVDFYHNGSTNVGSIGSDSGSLVIGGGDVGIGFYQLANAIVPYNNVTALRDSAIDLGLASSGRWKDLHASGTGYLGQVAIGTTSPNNLDAEGRGLVIASTGHTGLTILTTDADQRANILFADGTSGSEKFRGGITYDHSDDSLRIRTAGTANRMIISSSGAITKPEHPAFQARPSSVQTNVAINTTTTIVFGTEIFDLNGNFASNTFTAPVTGKYQLNANIFMQHINTDYSYLEIIITTSNRTYINQMSPAGLNIDNNSAMAMTHSVLADMDASDTAIVTINLPDNGSAQLDIHTYSNFSGYLVA